MKTFIKRIFYTLFLSFVFLELVLRIFQLAGHTIQESNIDGDRLLQPGMEGFWVRGGLGEIRSHYTINAQGWNSTIDYNIRDSSKINIALVGDSYIEGFHVDVENSIGRILESISREYVVHEYGRAGANIVDYSLAYEKWIKGNYDFTFILLTNKDLESTTSSFMNQGNSIPEYSLSRRIYNISYFIRYLNINHGMMLKLAATLKEGPILIIDNSASSDIDREDQFLEKVNMQALKKLDSEVVYLYEKGNLNSIFIEENSCQLIEEYYLPKDCGFDGHWNLNGRKNCAEAMIRYIEKNNGLQ